MLVKGWELPSIGVLWFWKLARAAVEGSSMCASIGVWKDRKQGGYFYFYISHLIAESVAGLWGWECNDVRAISLFTFNSWSRPIESCIQCIMHSMKLLILKRNISPLPFEIALRVSMVRFWVKLRTETHPMVLDILGSNQSVKNLEPIQFKPKITGSVSVRVPNHGFGR